MKQYSKYLFLTSIVALCLGGFSILLNHQGFTALLMDFIFLQVTIGVILYIWEAINENKI